MIYKVPSNPNCSKNHQYCDEEIINWLADKLEPITPLQEKKQHRSDPLYKFISYQTPMSVVLGNIFLKN